MQKKEELNYISIENSAANAKIALQGAHIFDFKIKGKKRLLYLSDTSLFKKGKAIRGGIPICWPWFGANEEDNTLPNHGFARTSLWKHESTKNISDVETKVRLILESTPETHTLWPFDFRLTLDVYIGEELKLVLTSKNLDRKPFSHSFALHTYFKIDDIYKMTIDGLEGKEFYNKCNNTYNNIQNDNIDFTQEVDRVYQRVDNNVMIRDKEQNIVIKTEGTDSIVVWNPGKELCSRMSDLGDYRTFVCVESANVLDDVVTLATNESYTLTLTISQKI